MKTDREYDIIINALELYRKEVKREMALAYYEGEKSTYFYLMKQMRKIDNALSDIRIEYNDVFRNGI